MLLPLSPRVARCRNSDWQETLELYVSGVLKGLLAFDNATAHSHTELLMRYRTTFHNYSEGMKYGSKLFAYLDRHWITTNHCETGRSPKDGVSLCGHDRICSVGAPRRDPVRVGLFPSER